MYFNICIDIFYKDFLLWGCDIPKHTLFITALFTYTCYLQALLQVLIYHEKLIYKCWHTAISFYFVNIAFNSYLNVVFVPIGRDLQALFPKGTDFLEGEDVLVVKRKENVCQFSLSHNEISFLHWHGICQSLTTSNSYQVFYILLFYLYIVLSRKQTSQDF